MENIDTNQCKDIKGFSLQEKSKWALSETKPLKSKLRTKCTQRTEYTLYIVTCFQIGLKLLT